MAQINLSRGMTAFVSDVDYLQIAQHQWTFQEGREHNVGYAIRWVTCPETKKRKKIYMHRCLVQPPAGLLVDHIDGNGLNNRRTNLRLATRKQNAQNVISLGLLGFKGVTYERYKYRVRINTGEQKISLGYYATAEEAARVYDRAAIQYHGVFAYLNFPREDYEDVYAYVTAQPPAYLTMAIPF